MREPRKLLPRILVIDDVYGRTVEGGNLDRVAICAQLRLEDITPGSVTTITIAEPLARAVFCRGQHPVLASAGDIVENDLPETLRVIDSGWQERPRGTPPWALVLLDLRFRGGVVTADSEERFGPGIPAGTSDDDSPSIFFGLRLLEEIQRRYPQLPVIVLSDARRESVSLQSTSLGAVAFLAKGDGAAAEKLSDYLQRHALLPDVDGEIVGNSVRLLVALRNARRAATGSESVLIRGETGTGKELLARFIHRHDPKRRGGPLAVVDSGTLSPELYASELFGHMRGAFTSAISDRTGRILEANHGILFLDEIGNVDAVVQRGLLRVLQEKQVRPVGGSRVRDVDVRFVFATNEDIERRAAAEDGFRFDLLERIRQGGTIVLPPLRERVDDLPSLIESILREAEAITPGAVPRTIDADTFDVIARYPWPGNIRQLRSCVIGAVRSRPDVEHLVPIHLDLPEIRPSGRPTTSHPSADDGVLAAAIAALGRVEPARLTADEIVGRYPELEAAFARASMRYLRTCIDAMRRPTMKDPDGGVFVHPAAKLMLGVEKLSASQAYDFIIRLHNLSPALAREWENEEVLGPLLKRARSQRRAGRRAPEEQKMEVEDAHG
jgi:DNA-binding NtrC family response regulator